QFGLDADAGVGDLDPKLTIPTAGGNGDPPTPPTAPPTAPTNRTTARSRLRGNRRGWGRELNGVGDEVEQGLLEAAGVGPDEAIVGAEPRGDGELFLLDLVAQHRDRVRDRRVGVDHLVEQLDLPFGDAGEIEQIVD